MTNEKCPKCGSEKFSVARNMKASRYCRCGHIWLPQKNEGVTGYCLQCEEAQKEVRQLREKLEIAYRRIEYFRNMIRDAGLIKTSMSGPYVDEGKWFRDLLKKDDEFVQ